MIVIKNIDFFRTDMDLIEIFNYTDPPGGVWVGREFLEVEFCKELIKGRRFIRPDGEEVVVGVSKQAQDVLGLLYEDWGKQRRALFLVQNAYRDVCVKLDSVGEKLEAKEGELDVYRNASFWQRLKYLFGGSGRIEPKHRK